jgi:phage protein U
MSFLSNVAGSYKNTVNRNMKNLASGIMGQLRGKLSSWGFSMPIGCLGDVMFTVSSREVRTFRDMKRTTKARYASHEIIGQKPILEYIGPDGEEITFSMQFHAALGVSPADETEKLREMCESGEAVFLVIGNHTVGQNQWVVESVGENVDTVDNCGRIIVTQVDVTIKEYVPSTLS